MSGGSLGRIHAKKICDLMVFAWPTAEIAQEYRAEFASPYQAAANAMITDVIEPAKTRSVILLALRNTLSKRDTQPPKKHGNIPL